jgi:uncharacterized protein YndB with AHSA1/START domain
VTGVKIEDIFDFEAPPEVVFNSLIDPERADRWLPSGIQVEWIDTGEVRAIVESKAATFAIDIDPDDLRLTWRSPGDQRLHGVVRAEDGPAGGCRLHVTVTMPQDGADPDRGHVLLAEAMRHLRRDVSDNFNAG